MPIHAVDLPLTSCRQCIMSTEVTCFVYPFHLVIEDVPEIVISDFKERLFCLMCVIPHTQNTQHDHTVLHFVR